MSEHLFEYAFAVARHLPEANPYDAAELSKVTRSLHRLYEAECNGELTPRQVRRELNLEQKAHDLAVKMGAVGVVLQGDPRGCPVFIVCKDGYTNDWGNRGIAVDW